MAQFAKDLFVESLDRCKMDPEFITKLYHRFIGSSEVVREKFKDTNFENQEKMLLRSLELSGAATEGDPEGLHELDERARTHNRHHLDIPFDLYELWLESIIETATECDPEWSDETEVAWRRILGFVIQHMTSRY